MVQIRRIFVADDLPLVRGGLSRIIEAEPDLCVAGAAASGAQLLQALQDRPSDLLLLDMGLPGQETIKLVQSVRAQFGRLPVLATSAGSDPGAVHAVLAAGALGYVSKGSDPAHLIDAIRTLLAGRPYVDPLVAFNILAAPAVVPAASLTAREGDVLRRLVAGRSNAEIAKELFLSEKTISAHKCHLMEKLEVSSIVDLIRYVDRHPHLIRKFPILL